jgi:hypothetical protein
MVITLKSILVITFKKTYGNYFKNRLWWLLLKKQYGDYLETHYGDYF